LYTSSRQKNVNGAKTGLRLDIWEDLLIGTFKMSQTKALRELEKQWFD
jgi:hypothetical protein